MAVKDQADIPQHNPAVRRARAGDLGCKTYLEPKLSAALGHLARKCGTTKAGLSRLAARRLLEQEEVGQVDPILGIIGLGNSGAGGVSEDHDRVLVEHTLSDRSG